MAYDPDEQADLPLAQKVAFLSDAPYPERCGPVTRRETHMSWVFFAGSAVYKLKKPIRLPYLDFSTLARREAACRAEFALNQALASDVYLGVVPLVRTTAGLQLGGEGEVVDWLVHMRRLDESLTLEARLDAGTLVDADLARLAAVLAPFYRRASRARMPPAWRLATLRRALAYDRTILLDPRLAMPAGAVRKVLALQQRFLQRGGRIIGARGRQGWVRDVHGDLRPEHVWLGSPVCIIDRLEFSRSLRVIDVLEEIAFLDMEMRCAGAAAAGRRLQSGLRGALHDTAPAALYLFYRSRRALLRSRLAIAHLQEPNPRTPEKWPRQARAYLGLALDDASRLALRLRRPAGP